LGKRFERDFDLRLGVLYPGGVGERRGLTEGDDFFTTNSAAFGLKTKGFLYPNSVGLNL
jgi:hypothetical protein